MTDKNGKEIKIGDKAVLIGKDHDDLEGKIGEIRGISENWGAFNSTITGKTIMRKGQPRVRIADGPDDNPLWSAWCKPKDIVVT